MYLLSAVICLCCSLFMFMGIYSLYAISSAAYSSGFYTFPIILLLLSIYLFYCEINKNN